MLTRASETAQAERAGGVFLTGSSLESAWTRCYKHDICGLSTGSRNEDVEFGDEAMSQGNMPSRPGCAKAPRWPCPTINRRGLGGQSGSIRPGTGGLLALRGRCRSSPCGT